MLPFIAEITIFKGMFKRISLGIFISLMLVSCQTYFVSVDTLRGELSQQNDTLLPRMANVKSENSTGKVKTISLKPNQSICAVLKQSPPEKPAADTLKGVRRRYIPPAPIQYPKRQCFYVDDAQIKNDTLYAFRSCYSCDSIKIPLDSINHIEIQSEQVVRAKSKKKGIWFTPSYTNEIDGLSLSAWTTTMPTELDTLKINGMNLGVEVQWTLLSMAAAQGVILLPFMAADALFTKKDTTTIHKEPAHRNECSRKCPSPDSSIIIINGFNLGILGSPIEANKINGLNICGIGTYSSKLSGISVTGLATVSDDFEGVCISGLVNHTKRGRGLQIGVANFSTDFQGVQIGLWNKIGKIGLPFINVRFKKRKIPQSQVCGL